MGLASITHSIALSEIRFHFLKVMIIIIILREDYFIWIEHGKRIIVREYEWFMTYVHFLTTSADTSEKGRHVIRIGDSLTNIVIRDRAMVMSLECEDSVYLIKVGSN